MADLQLVRNEAIEIPAWATSYVFDFKRARPGVPCPVCREPIAPGHDPRSIGLAVLGGQRLCEDCLHDEVPAPLLEVLELLDGVLATVGALDEGELVIGERHAVRLCTLAAVDWLAQCMRRAIDELSP